MNSSRSGGNSSFAAFAASAGGSSSSKGKKIEGSGSFKGTPDIEQLSRDMTGVSLDSTEDGEWEVIGKKSKNRVAATSGKAWGSSTPRDLVPSAGLPGQGRGTNGGSGRTAVNSWAQISANGGAARAPGKRSAQAGPNVGSVRIPGNNRLQPGDYQTSSGRGNPKTQTTSRNLEPAYMAPPAAIPPPFHNGGDWRAIVGSSGSQLKAVNNISGVSQDGSLDKYDSDSDIVRNQPVSDDDDELIDDSDDDLSDDYDSDVSQMSHETRKKNKWLKGFFDDLDKLTADEISDTTRQWHCPACQNGPGAIDWYKGLQPLVAHAKTKGGKRAKIHRELSKLLDEEIRQRGASITSAGEVFGKWRGLRETTTDHQIVWPPMVIVMNTFLEQDENEKWIGMGNQELIEYFSSYAASKARHSYGPRGHRGMSVLIFEATAMGYMEAERLHKHFAEQGTDRDAWDRRRVLFYPGGKRQLYGYLARKEDMDVFNQHCQGKSRLKFDMKSYQEMVVIPMKQMSEDNQQLRWLKNTVVKQEQHSKVLEETCGLVSKKLRETMEENRIVRLRTKMQHEENKVEMDYQEHFFKEQMAKVQKDIEDKEQKYETLTLLEEERSAAKQFDIQSGSGEDGRLRRKEIRRTIDSQLKDVEEFVAEKKVLISLHEKKKEDLKRRYMDEVVELEKAFETALTGLMQKHAPGTFQASGSF